jgi:hypothetical protein
MSDLRKLTEKTIQQARLLTNQAAKSVDLLAMKDAAILEFSVIRKNASRAIDRIKGTKPRTAYTEVAEVCEDINDALVRENSGATSKMTRLAAAKLGAIGNSAGIFGVAATVGTAGTGTAIGVLSGAAATSATLAWVGGSVVVGGAIVAAVAVAGGIGFAAGAFWVFNKYWRGKKRLQEQLSEREQQIAEVTSKLAVACRRMEAGGHELKPQVARAIYEETLAPLCEKMIEEEGLHSDWPRGAVNRLRTAVRNLNDIATRLRYLGLKSPTITITVFATVVTHLFQGDLSDLTHDQELVLEALKRSRNDLENATDDELIKYINTLSEIQIDGVINNVKGIYHELLFVAAENNDGDIFSAALFEATNHPGADVIITNELTGEVQEVQLKATKYLSYIEKHNERFAEFEVFATEEVAGNGISSSGFSNEKVSSDTEDAMSVLKKSGESVVDDAMATSALVALAFQLGRVIRTRDISEAAAIKATTEVTKTAFLSGFLAWAIE